MKKLNKLFKVISIILISLAITLISSCKEKKPDITNVSSDISSIFVTSSTIHSIESEYSFESIESSTSNFTSSTLPTTTPTGTLTSEYLSKVLPTVTPASSKDKSSSISSSLSPTPDVPKTVLSFRKQGDENTLGVWWWGITTIRGEIGNTYLQFCVDNNISEIYLSIDKMSAAGADSFEVVRNFVKTAKNKGIRVAALTGDYKWIEPTNIGFQKYVDKFNAYQNAANADEKFYSMHLDVEPHQHPDFKTGPEGRAKIMQWFAEFAVNKAVVAAKNSNTLLEWDIPFWLVDIVKNPEDNQDINLAELMAKICDTIVIMSYRDTAIKMYDVSKEEIAFAKQYGCKIVLGAETYSKEGDQVSFMEEGKAIMNIELSKLNTKLLAEFPERNFGIAVHQIARFYDLKD